MHLRRHRFFAYVSLVVVFILKGLTLAGMLALHLKFNFNLKYRSDQPQRLEEEDDGYGA